MNPAMLRYYVNVQCIHLHTCIQLCVVIVCSAVFSQDSQGTLFFDALLGVLAFFSFFLLFPFSNFLCSGTIGILKELLIKLAAL